jgi:hypothetical protein
MGADGDMLRSQGETIRVEPRHVLATIDDEAELAALSSWLGHWEPLYAVDRPPRDKLLYEPDGTLFALGLGTAMTIELNHRRRVIGKGDVIVVPPALALEVEPEVDFLAVRWGGTVPDQFRERFVQVWGYEHFPADLEATTSPADRDAFREQIPESDLRFACAVATWRLAGIPGPSVPRTTGHDVALLLGLEGQAEVGVSETGLVQPVGRGRLLGLGPGLTYRGAGRGRLAVLRLSSAMMLDARKVLDRGRRGEALSSESSPAPSRPDRPRSPSPN